LLTGKFLEKFKKLEISLFSDFSFDILIMLEKLFFVLMLGSIFLDVIILFLINDLLIFVFSKLSIVFIFLNIFGFDIFNSFLISKHFRGFTNLP
jgi:hypothetical protein